MDYYIFKHAVDSPETGPIYPQVQKMAPTYDYDSPISVHALSREITNLPDYEPNLDYFIVHSKAKLTDLLSVSVVSGGFLMSKRFKTIIELFDLPTHKFYPAKVKHKQTFYDYYWMHIICDLTDIVDYSKSKFFIYHNYSDNLGNINVNSKDEFLQKKQKIKSDNPGKTITIWAEKIWLSNKFNSKLDLFEIGSFDANFYVSARLHQMIVKENVTGCSFKQASNLIAS